MPIKGRWAVKPPRKHARPIGSKWDKATLVSLNIPPVMPFASEKGYVGSYFIWVICGRKWVYIKKPQTTKIETPKQLRLKLADWEKIIKSRCTPDFIRRHGGNLGYEEITPPLN